MSNVLLIDDDPDFTFGLNALLNRSGHEVVVAHRAADALSAVKGASFDVAFVDLQLPDADGLTMLSMLAAADPLLPAICLTGRNDTSVVVKAIRSGAMDYLTKPVDRQTLLAAIASAADYSASRRAGAERTHGLAMPIGDSPAWRRAMDLVVAAAASPRTTVLLTGEPGVGKEVAATLLHRLSKRSDAPLVCANAACFSPALVESELFGHEAGAFTGASKRRRGLFEQAEGGLLFLDEIGELPLELQSKLLRVLEGHPFRRVGGEEPTRVDVRLVCATNRDLADLTRRGLFRADLYERLRVFEIPLPPLRERREDILHLTHHFLAKLGQELGRPTVDVAADAMEALHRHAWPGNVRELRNVIERALVLASGNTLTLQHLPHQLWELPLDSARGERGALPARGERGALDPARSERLGTGSHPAPDVRLEEVERRHIVAVFEDTGHNVTRSAERLGMSRLSLRKRLQAYGLRPVRS